MIDRNWHAFICRHHGLFSYLEFRRATPHDAASFRGHKNVSGCYVLKIGDYSDVSSPKSNVGIRLLLGHDFDAKSFWVINGAVYSYVVSSDWDRTILLRKHKSKSSELKIIQDSISEFAS